MEKLLTWDEYCEIMETPGEPRPDWFDNDQLLALSCIFNNMSQTQIFPNSYTMYLKMKENYKKDFNRALAFQIKYIYENKEVLYNNPLDALTSNSVQTYSKGPINLRDIKHFQDVLAPTTEAILLSMGWLYKGLGCIYKVSQYYNI